MNRVKCVQYLGLMIDCFYWHMHVQYVYDSLVKYFGIYNHIKTIISKKIATLSCFYTFAYKFGIEVFGDCANEYLQKLQVIQNKFLNLNQILTAECLLMNYISNCLCWKWLIFILLMCCNLLMNADPAGVQLCSQAIIMCEKQGTNSDRVIAFMCLWQEPISAKVLVKSKVPGYGIISSTWLIIICIKKL